jgi:hypothetical protein
MVHLKLLTHIIVSDNIIIAMQLWIFQRAQQLCVGGGKTRGSGLWLKMMS